MGNLIRMDIYRMFRSKTFLVCLILTFALALALAPLEKLMSSLSSLINTETKTEESLELDEAKMAKALQEVMVDNGMDPDSESPSGMSPEMFAKVLSKAGIKGDITKAKPDSNLDKIINGWGGDVKALKAEMDKLSKDDSSGISFDANVTLGEIIRDPFGMLGAMLMMISVCSFFYADVENGFIKNIAGQVPKKGLTICSKFAAVIPHNLAFMAAGVAGNLIGCLIVKKISAGDIAGGVGDFLLKLLLAQAICAMLVLFVSTFRNKSLGTVIAVVMGLGLLGLIYGLIDSGIQKLLPDAGDIFSKYMPDVLMGKASPGALESILVSALFIGVFLNLAVNLFDKRDVK